MSDCVFVSKQSCSCHCVNWPLVGIKRVYYRLAFPLCLCVFLTFASSALLSLSPVTENAIQSFGYGSEGSTLLVTEPSATFLPPAQPPIISKPAPSLHGNAIKPMDSACMFSTCANLQVSFSHIGCVYGFCLSQRCGRTSVKFFKPLVLKSLNYKTNHNGN